MNHNLCVVIPLYKQLEAIEATLTDIERLGLDSIVVDDGNEPDLRERLQKITSQFHHTVLHSLDSNQGKGGAVMAGLKLAHQMGYTHALQIDADGQHDRSQIPAMRDLSLANPEAIVLGQPVYDASANKFRVACRYLNAFWVNVQLFSFSAPDAMCGFRVYPLAATCTLLNRVRLGRRMDFDIEVLIRLIRDGVPVVKHPTKVIYHTDSQSNFQYVPDNYLIVKMHVKLLLEALHALVFRRSHPKRSKTDPQHWAEVEELGFTSGIRFLVWSYRFFGAGVFKAILWPVIVYYFQTNQRARQASLEYLQRVYRAGSDHPEMAAEPGPRTVFKHFLEFGYFNLDRIASWFGAVKLTDLDFVQKDEFLGFVQQGKGALLISSHLGNIEMCRALITQYPRVKFHVIMHTAHADKFNSVLKEINSQSDLRVIQVGDIGPETATFLHERIEAGEYIVILGDRTPVHSQGRVSEVEFLGDRTFFPQGPYLLAHLLGCPVFTMFCLKESGRYRLYIEPFAERIRLARKDRERSLQAQAQRYADILQHYCLKEPLQWFNFYDFWSADTSARLEDKRDEIKAS